MPLDETGRDEVVIVGGGLSGLVAAYRLEAAGIRPHVVEARERCGGRIKVGDHASTPDLGPAWIWPSMNPRITSLLDELSLECFAQYVGGDSLLDLGGAPTRRPSYGQGSMRIRGGVGALIDALVSKLRHTSIQLGTHLTRLHAREGSIALHLEGRQHTTRLAHHVVSTIPPRLLATSIAWSPVLPEAIITRWRKSPTWMAGHAKFVAAYSRPFWREEGLSGAGFSRVGPMVEVHDHSDMQGEHGALFGFIGVDAARRMALEPGLLERACLEQLERMFGPDAADPEWHELADWAQERWTAHHLDIIGTGAHPTTQSSDLPAPFTERVRLAGTEFSRDFPGYLEGAVCAGEEAAKQIIQHRGLRDEA